MKKNIGFVGLLILGVVCNLACSKSDTKECEAQNYGTVRVTYGGASTANVKNITIVNSSGGGVRSKEIATGGKEDTLHLKPGTYTINLNQVSGFLGLISTKTVTTTVTTCSEASFTN